MANDDAAEAIAKAMELWNVAERGGKYLCPNATPEELYQKTKALFELALGIHAERKN